MLKLLKKADREGTILLKSYLLSIRSITIKSMNCSNVTSFYG